MTATSLPEIQQLREFGSSHARAGNPKPDFATWSATYGAGELSVQAHRAFCRGFDLVRNAARISVPRRQRVAVPA